MILLLFSKLLRLEETTPPPLPQCVHAQSPICIQLFSTIWTVARQASLFMEFSRQEYWSGLPFPSPGDIPDPGIEPVLLHCRGILYITVSPWILINRLQKMSRF